MNTGRRLSQFGAALTLTYLAWAGFCAWSALGTADIKGKVLMLQLGVLPQSMLLDGLGGRRWLEGWHWAAIYALLVPPFAALLYFIGAWFTRRWR